MSGDIVSVIAPDYKKQVTTVIPPELQYVEVIAVTANSGYDANTGEREEEDIAGHSDTFGSARTEQGIGRIGGKWEITPCFGISWDKGKCKKIY